MNETAQPRTQQDILNDYASGKIERSELKIKEVARIEKFEITEEGKKFIGSVTLEDGIIVSEELPPLGTEQPPS